LSRYTESSAAVAPACVGGRDRFDEAVEAFF
jgi:hypothetical protein